MVVVKGKTARMLHEVLRRTTWAFPHAFPEGEFDRTKLLNTPGRRRLSHGGWGLCRSPGPVLPDGWVGL